MRFRSALLTALVALHAPGARGMENQVRLDVGMASPVGFLGVVYARDFGRWFQLEAGVGYGFTGVQLELMPRLTAGTTIEGGGLLRFVLGAGPSVGVGPALADVARIDQDQAPVFFVNAEVGVEYKGRSGFSMMAALGWTYAPAPGRSRDCSKGPFGDPSRPSNCGEAGFPALRIGFGYSF